MRRVSENETRESERYLEPRQVRNGDNKTHKAKMSQSQIQTAETSQNQKIRETHT